MAIVISSRMLNLASALILNGENLSEKVVSGISNTLLIPVIEAILGKSSFKSPHDSENFPVRLIFQKSLFSTQLLMSEAEPENFLIVTGSTVGSFIGTPGSTLNSTESATSFVFSLPVLLSFTVVCLTVTLAPKPDCLASMAKRTNPPTLYSFL